MEDKIEVGEYVRTKKGIGKILDIKMFQTKMHGKNDVAYLIDICIIKYISKTIFIKHSKNIIDLIEVGDYVNGYKILNITEIDNNKDKKVFTIFKNGKTEFVDIWENKDINSIVTHEQFENINYEVK